MAAWIVGWMAAEMDTWLPGRLAAWMEDWKAALLDIGLNRRMAAWLHRWMVAWMPAASMDYFKNGWLHGRMEA